MRGQDRQPGGDGPSVQVVDVLDVLDAQDVAAHLGQIEGLGGEAHEDASC